MNYQEAIKEAETQIDVYENMILYNKDFEPKNGNSNYENKIDFLKTAIYAMKELQEIQEQGFSLERLKDIDFRKDVIEHINYDAYIGLQEELEEYNKIGTLEEVSEAVEKQKEKKPIVESIDERIFGRKVENVVVYCPTCGYPIASLVDIVMYGFCRNCGQHIDWSE